MDLFQRSFILKNYFPVANKKLKILFLVFTASFLYPAHSSNIGRCTGDVVSWNSCYNSVKFADSGVWALGEWKNGRLNGLAIMSWGDKGAYVGEVREGKFHGYGAHDDTDSSYVGDFFEGKKHGLGRSFSKDGSYIGEFKNGAFHGKGILRNGNAIKQGLFENGTLKEDKTINPNPVFDDEVINRSNIRTAEYQLLKFVSGFIKPKMTEEEIAYMGHLIKKTGYANATTFEFSGDFYRSAQWEAMESFGDGCRSLKIIPKNLRISYHLERAPRTFESAYIQSKEHEVIYFDKDKLFIKFSSLDDYFADKKKCAENTARFQYTENTVPFQYDEEKSWEKLFSGTNVVVYIDKSSVKKNKNKVRAWLFRRYSDPICVDYCESSSKRESYADAVKIYVDIDCNEGLYRGLAYETRVSQGFYDKALIGMLGENADLLLGMFGAKNEPFAVLQRSNKVEEWHTIVDSAELALQKGLCAR
jgi:hypothetical protein